MSDHVDAKSWTLQQFMGATQADIAKGLTSETLKSASHQDSTAMGSWAAKAGGEGVRAELAGHVTGFLQGSIDDLFGGVWSKCTELKKSTEETRGKSGVTQLVALADHDFVYSMKPEVEIVIAGVRLGSFKFAIELRCAVKALQLHVRDGGVAEVAAGMCESSSAISLAGMPLWQKKLAHVDLPGTLIWKQPMPLQETAA